MEVSSEIKENIDATLKEAAISEVPSEVTVAASKQPEPQASIMGESTLTAGKNSFKNTIGHVEKTLCIFSESIQGLNIQEGDIFFALATFVSETGEAMNLVEGEKVHVLEWNNTDWWYVRKHLTEESGWVPAQYLKDEQTYTMYVQKKLVEKIEKLPVFDSKYSSIVFQKLAFHGCNLFRAQRRRGALCSQNFGKREIHVCCRWKSS